MTEFYIRVRQTSIHDNTWVAEVYDDSQAAPRAVAQANGGHDAVRAVLEEEVRLMTVMLKKLQTSTAPCC